MCRFLDQLLWQDRKPIKLDFAFCFCKKGEGIQFLAILCVKRRKIIEAIKFSLINNFGPLLTVLIYLKKKKDITF